MERTNKSSALCFVSPLLQCYYFLHRNSLKNCMRNKCILWIDKNSKPISHTFRFQYSLIKRKCVLTGQKYHGFPPKYIPTNIFKHLFELRLQYDQIIKTEYKISPTYRHKSIDTEKPLYVRNTKICVLRKYSMAEKTGRSRPR